MATLLYGSNSPPQTVALPNCGPVPQPYPALLPASLDWPLEEKELPDPLAFQVSVCCLFIPVCVWCVWFEQENNGECAECYRITTPLLCMSVFVYVCGQKNVQSLILLCVIPDTAVTQWRMDAGANWLQNSSSYETSKRAPHSYVFVAIMYFTTCKGLQSLNL